MQTRKGSTKGRRAVRAVCCALAAAAAAELWYLPRYLTDKTVFDASRIEPAPQIRVMSANVRCFSPTDLGKKSWFYRAALLCRDVAQAQPDVIGFQEVMPLHYAYLTEHLRGYSHSVVYRDSAPLSEGCPIFYNARRFEAADEGTFWLSETPERSSKSPGAAFPQDIRPHKNDSARNNEENDQRCDRADHHTAVPLLLSSLLLCPGEAGSPLFDRFLLFHIRLPLPLRDRLCVCRLLLEPVHLLKILFFI